MQTILIEPDVSAPSLRSLIEACFEITDTDKMLRSLDCVMGQNMMDGALAILQPITGGPKICHLQCNSRSLCLVKGSNQQYYLCVQNDHCEYCSCRSFTERCRKKEPYCKHLLALKLFPLLGINESEAVRVESFPNELAFSTAVTERLFKPKITR